MKLIVEVSLLRFRDLHFAPARLVSLVPTRCASKSGSVFRAIKKSFHHLSINKVTVELIELCQPEIEASVICVLRIIGIASQVTVVLHQHKRAVEFRLLEILIISNRPQSLRTRREIYRIPGTAK